MSRASDPPGTIAGTSSQLARGFQAQVTIDDLAVASGEHRDFEAKFPDATAHPIHGRIVLARVAGVEN
jgi:hypothetical protein